MPVIEVGGTKLAYQEFGSGDKVLISTQNFFLPAAIWSFSASRPIIIMCT